MSAAAVAPTRRDGPVLVLAPRGDRLAGTARDELACRGVPVVWLDPGDFPGGWDVGWSVLGGGRVPRRAWGARFAEGATLSARAAGLPFAD